MVLHPRVYDSGAASIWNLAGLKTREHKGLSLDCLVGKVVWPGGITKTALNIEVQLR